jgi:hypothetical protein
MNHSSDIIPHTIYVVILNPRPASNTNFLRECAFPKFQAVIKIRTPYIIPKTIENANFSASSTPLKEYLKTTVYKNNNAA